MTARDELQALDAFYRANLLRDRLLSLELYGFHVFLWRQWKRGHRW